MKKLMNKKVFAVILFTALVIVPIMGMASGDLGDFGLTGENGADSIGLGNADVKEIVNNIIVVILGFLGLIAVVLILIGGFMWMTAGGNEEKVADARKTLQAAVIGLLIILASYGISLYVFVIIEGATGQGAIN